MAERVVIVFTLKSVEHILRDGGTQSWRLDPNHARDCAYAVCTRNRGPRSVEGPEDHQAAFLVGRILDVVRNTEDPRFDRYLIRFSEYALVSIPGVWRGDRNPVKYSTIDDVPFDPTKLEWKPMPKPVVTPASPEHRPESGLSIAEAKRAVAARFGVSPDAVEITIRG
jgi:hypothetical protein